VRFGFAVLLSFVAAAAFAEEPKFTPPVLKQKVAAPYPEEAAKAGIEGVVVLELDVDPAGRVASARVIAPAGHGFDEAALEAVRQFAFEPGRSGDQPVPVRVTYRYSFKLASAAKPPPPVEKPPDPVRLRGTVNERGTRAAIHDATIVVLDLEGHVLARAEATADGKFEVRLPAEVAGLVVVAVAASDHRVLRVREKLAPHEALTVNYAIARNSYAQYESVVRGAPQREEVARVSLEGDEIRRIPGTKGDALAAVLNLPSVARSPFDLGQLVIRGSQPGESAAFISGVEIPQPFHFGLGTSTFNSYLLERFDLIPSNFSARYGRLTGGVVDIVPRDAKKDRWHGDIKADIYDAHIIAEGPVKKGGLALSIRRSYIDGLLRFVLPSDTFTVAPRYYDYQGMFDYPLAGGKFKLTIFGSDDEVAFVSTGPSDQDPSLSGRFGTHLWFHHLIASYVRKWNKFELDTMFSFGAEHSDAVLGQAARFNLDVLASTVRIEARYKPHRRLKITAGLDLLLDHYWVTVLAPSPPTEERVLNPLSTLERKRLESSGLEVYPAIYAQADWIVNDRLTITPGVRVDWFDSKKGTYVQPRLMAKLRIAHETFLKAGLGFYYMPPQAPYDNKVLGNPAVKPTQAIHATLGVETRPIRRWLPFSIAVNLFYKDIRNLAVASDGNLIRDGRAVPEVYIDEGVGRVYGADLLIKHDSPKYVYGWIAYTLTKSERMDHPGEPWRPFQYDQTNILTVVLGAHLPRDFDVGLRLRWVTSNPSTSQLAAARRVYDADRDTHYPVPGPAYGERLPDFVQLDLRIDKRFAFRKWIFAIYLDVTNVTNRGNVEAFAYSYDFTRRAPITGLPILPSLGLRASF
jgi:TonB family protein